MGNQSMKIITYVNERAVENERAKLSIKSGVTCNRDRVYYSRIRLSGDLLSISPASDFFTGKGFGEGGTERGCIKSLSQSSSARMGRYLRECISEYKVMVTLTYPSGFGLDGKRAKRDLHVFFKRASRQVSIRKDLFSMFWFMEFQKTGRIHFHILSTHRIDIKWLSQAWYEIVGSDDPLHLKAGTNIEKLKLGRAGAASYARKYARKNIQKIVPENLKWVGRFWGVYGVKTQRSAGIVLTANSLKNDTILKKITLLSDTIEKMISEKRARLIDSANIPVMLIAIKDKNAILEIESLINRIDLLNFAYAGIGSWEGNLDLEDDLPDLERTWCDYLGRSGERWKKKVLLQAE